MIGTNNRNNRNNRNYRNNRKLSYNTNNKHCALSRTLVLRLFFVGSLLVAAVLCGCVTYVAINNHESHVGDVSYESVAIRALEGAQAIALGKVSGGDIITCIISEAFRNVSMWPMVFPRGFSRTASEVGKLSSSKSHSFIPLIRPEQASEFEAFAQSVYKELGYPETAGRSEFGFGIYGLDPDSGYSDERYHDIDGNTSYGSNYSILAPIFLHSVVNANNLMLNVRSEAFRGAAIDSVISCVEAANSSPPSCVVVTDWVKRFRGHSPMAIIYQPVFPADYPSKAVGVVATPIHWSRVLTKVVPDYVDGLYCVISTKTETYTYVIHQGIPELLGNGDLHDPRFASYGRSVILNDMNTNASASVIYTLTVYPSDMIFDQFFTNDPLFVSLGFVATIAGCSVLFFLYDFFMKNKSNQRQEVLEMKRRFVRFISHEIRTPLNTVCMGLQLLMAELEEGIDKFSASYWLDLTGVIVDNSRNAVSVLNDLLNYDKIETGNCQLEVGAVFMLNLVKKTVEEFHIQVRNKKITLNLDLQADEDGREEKIEPNLYQLNVIGDDMRLRQVIWNLVSNALKFTPEDGTGIISVTTSHVPNGLPNAKPLMKIRDGNSKTSELICPILRSGSIRISVKDNGAGMSQDQLRLLFQEGVQFAPNKLQGGGGSGLGLFITKAIVEQHEGIIEVDSGGFGQGSTFVIELPLYKCPSSTTEKKDVETLETKTDTALCSHSLHIPATTEIHRILVVDDDLMNRKMLVRLLERSGHTCLAVENGQQAINSFLADEATANANSGGHVSFDTILMDFEMPVLNGPDATKILREMGCKTSIIGLTGNILDEDVAFFKSQGADDVLGKPVNLALIDRFWAKSAESKH